jgi:general secretion pathway protein L
VIGSADVMNRALSWWGDELCALLPRPVRRFFGADRPVQHVSADAPAATVQDDCELVLLLRADRALARTLALPPAAAADLRAALAFELERQTPFRAEEVWLGWRAEAGDEDALRVRLVVARRSDVASALQRLAERGLQAEAVEVEGELGLRLEVPSLAGRRKGVGWLNLGLAALLVALGTAALAAPAWRAERERAALMQEIAALRPAVDRALALRAESDRLLGDAERVVRAKGEAPVATRLLEEMSRVLPDDAWLGQFNVAEGKVEIEGVAASAAALVRAIEASPLFGAVQYRAPVSADAVTRMERFQFAVELERP